MRKLNLILVCLLLAPLLQGCVGAVVAGGAAGVAIAADHRSISTIATDEKITYRVKKKIKANPDVARNTHIVVISYNRVVLLAGQAQTADMRSQIEQLAGTVPNVRRIFNEITVGEPSSNMQRSRDTAITANVKTRLIATTNVSAKQIKVVTENGTVFLMGVTTRDKADAAAQVARNSSGVQRVVKLIEYVNED